MPAGRTRTGRVLALVAVGVAGCGTTRTTDTTRTATEMVLVSQAVDNAVARIDFAELAGKPVYLDTQYLDGAVDKGYVISSLRQHLLAHGALLMEDRKSATFVVEPRSGGIGTDRHGLLVGTPQMTLPAVVPGMPTSVPEIALIKRTDQKGVAKLAVFAYNRTTGHALWRSELVEAESHLKDTWVFGAGPYSRGSIRKQPELAGEPLPHLALPFLSSPAESPASAPAPPDPQNPPAAGAPVVRAAGAAQPPTAVMPTSR